MQQSEFGSQQGCTKVTCGAYGSLNLPSALNKVPDPKIMTRLTTCFKKIRKIEISLKLRRSVAVGRRVKCSPVVVTKS